MNRHGAFEFSWDGDLLTIKMIGPFNEDGVRVNSEEIKAAIRQKNLPSWRRLEILDENTLGSIPTLEYSRVLYDWYGAHGCRAAAIVITNSVQAGVLQKYIKCNDPTFSNLDDAMTWIKDR